MSTLTVTAKGQVTLKKDVLEHLGVGPGARIVVDKLPNGRIEARAAPSGDITEFFDALKWKRKGKPVLTIEEMNEVIASAWAGKR